MHKQLCRVLAAGSQLAVGALAQQISLDLGNSATPPSDASPIIHPSYAGFGIEPSNLFAFTGGATPNTLSTNLLGNLAGLTGGYPPSIRLGGNTQDYMIYRESNDDWHYDLNRDSVGQGNLATDHMIVGPRYFEAANRFPTGTPVTWGLNLAYSEPDYVEQITTMAEQVLSRCDNLNVVSFEIGNEPDIYNLNGFRDRDDTWNGAVYTDQWLDRASALWQQVLSPRDLTSNMFEPGATAFTQGTSFQISDLMQDGIGVDANNSDSSFIYGWNQHNYFYFIGVTDGPITLDRVLQWSQTENALAAWTPQVSQAEETPYPFFLREMAIVGPLGQQGVSDTFAAALWTLNFLLYSTTLNMSSVQFHMTENSNASAWQPVEWNGRQPFVRPLYYGIAAFDQIVGTRACETQVSQYQITDYPTDYADLVRAYLVHRDGELASIVVVNGRMANSTQSDKPSLTVQATLPSSYGGETLHLSYLTGAGADATEDTVWNGISYEESGDGTPSQVSDTDPQTVKVESDGSASFSVRDSEAVVAYVGSRLGSETCTAGAQRAPTTASSTSSPTVTATDTSSPDPTGPARSNNNNSGTARWTLLQQAIKWIAWSSAFTVGICML